MLSVLMRSTKEVEMADDQNSNEKPPEDKYLNLKSEMSRKTANLEQMLAAQNAKSEALMQAVIQMQQAKAKAKQDISTSDDEIDDIGVDPIDDPKKFAKRVEQRATQKAVQYAEQRAQEQARSQSEQQGALLTLASDYPELNDIGSDLYKQALELSRQMPDSYRNSAVGLKAAVREAAANLGVLPVSKRSKKDEQDDDSFNVDSSSSRGGKKRSNKDAEGEVPQDTLAWAELLGRPINDPKYIERLKKATQRKDWKRFK